MICYTDGSCLMNGRQENSGGFGVVFLDDNENFIDCYQKQSINTTNNREELKAIIYVLITQGKNTKPVIVYSDSAYCVNTLTSWMYGWQKRGWIKSDKKTPENLDIIKNYYKLEKEGYHIELKKVKGHNGVQWNEVADQLATHKITTEEVKKLYGSK